MYIQVVQSKNFYRIVRDILWTLVLFIWQLEVKHMKIKGSFTLTH